MTQQTSRESFHKLKPSQTQAERQKILDYLQRYPYLKFSDRDISQATGLPINIVESRRNNLAKQELIEYAGIIYDKNTDRRVQSWRAKR